MQPHLVTLPDGRKIDRCKTLGAHQDVDGAAGSSGLLFMGSILWGSIPMGITLYMAFSDFFESLISFF